MHTINFQTNSGNNSDFHLDAISVDCPTSDIINLENITDSTTSSTIDEKAVNKTEQCNGNNESQLYCEGIERNSNTVFDYQKAFDEDILFVCAEEVINSCVQNRENEGATNEERPIQIQSVLAEEVTTDAKEISKNEEPTKGRIYVVSNLMKTTTDTGKQVDKIIAEIPNENQMVEVIESNDEEDEECVKNSNFELAQVIILDTTKKPVKRKKTIGRPKGGRNNRYSCEYTFLS